MFTWHTTNLTALDTNILYRRVAKTQNILESRVSWHPIGRAITNRREASITPSSLIPVLRKGRPGSGLHNLILKESRF